MSTDLVNNLVEQGKERVFEGEYEQAIACYTKAIKIEADNALLHYYRGIAYLKMNDDNHTRKAIDDFNLARVLIITEDGTRTINNSITEDSSDMINDSLEGEVYSHLGFAHSQIGENDISVEWYIEAIHLGAKFTNEIQADPNLIEAYAQVGDTLEFVENYEEAINAILHNADTLKIDSNNSKARFALGYLYKKLGTYNEAVAELTEAIRLDNENMRAYNCRGDIYCNQGKWNKAIEDYTVVIKNQKHESCKDINIAFVLQNRSMAYKQKGDLEKAKADQIAALDIAAAYEKDKSEEQTT